METPTISFDPIGSATGHDMRVLLSCPMSSAAIDSRRDEGMFSDDGVVDLTLHNSTLL